MERPPSSYVEMAIREVVGELERGSPARRAIKPGNQRWWMTRAMKLVRAVRQDDRIFPKEKP